MEGSEVTCPACHGRGTHTNLHGPRGGSVGVGSHIMVQTLGPTYTKCLVTGFKHSGIKLVHDGHWTFTWPNGKKETRHSSHADDSLKKVCPRCQGDKKVALTARDLLILQRGILFLVSGRGTVSAARGEDGRWWKYLSPNIRGSDLLTSENTVYSVASTIYLDAYQILELEERGSPDVADFIPGHCDLHGWFEGPKCPECDR